MQVIQLRNASNSAAKCKQFSREMQAIQMAKSSYLPSRVWLQQNKSLRHFVVMLQHSLTHKMLRVATRVSTPLFCRTLLSAWRACFINQSSNQAPQKTQEQT